MTYLLLALSTCASAGKAIICKKIGTAADNIKSVSLMNTAVFATALLISFGIVIVSGSSLAISPFSLLLSVVFAASLSATQLCEIKAMALGNASLTILIFSCGFLIPVVMGAVFWEEAISRFQLLGIVLLLLALYLIIGAKGTAKVHFRWLFFSIIAMSCSGLSATIQKIHQRSEFAGELPAFLVYTFAIASLLSLVIYLFCPAAKNAVPISGKKFFGLAAVNGVLVGALSFLNLTLAGLIPAVILFPVYNVGGMILTGILGAVLFREHITKTQLVGFLIGCAAIVIVGVL